MTRHLQAVVRQGVVGLAVAGCVLVTAGCAPSQPAAPAAQAAQGSANVSSTQEVLDRHMKTFGSQDLAGVLADYAPDAVMFTPGGPVKGTAALRPVFETLFAEWGKPGGTFELKQQTVDGNNAYLFWNATTAENVYEAGMDAFVVNNGKIVAHFFSAKITPKAAAKK